MSFTEHPPFFGIGAARTVTKPTSWSCPWTSCSEVLCPIVTLFLHRDGPSTATGDTDRQDESVHFIFSKGKLYDVSPWETHRGGRRWQPNSASLLHMWCMLTRSHTVMLTWTHWTWTEGREFMFVTPGIFLLRQVKRAAAKIKGLKTGLCTACKYLSQLPTCWKSTNCLPQTIYYLYCSSLFYYLTSSHNSRLSSFLCCCNFSNLCYLTKLPLCSPVKRLCSGVVIYDRQTQACT